MVEKLFIPMLSKKQIIVLSKAARAAWEHLGPRGRGDSVLRERLDDDFASETKCFELWRHDQIEKVCGVRSYKLVTQDQYRLLLMHLQNLGGNAAAAAHSLRKSAGEGRRRALWLLRRNCEERGLAYPEYPEAICRRQYRCALDDAGEGQLMRLVYTVRARRKPGGEPRRGGTQAHRTPRERDASASKKTKLTPPADVSRN
ncbi:MAG: hypothetical protein ACOC4K_00390 [Verrucomicrobiota bacterium]